MKKFKDFKIGDNIYFAKVGSIEYSSESIDNIQRGYFLFEYGRLAVPDKLRSKRIIKHKENNYSPPALYFANESDAIRYCKAQMIKELHRLIDTANEAIQKVKNFRKRNYHLLNKDWTEREILRLENELK